MIQEILVISVVLSIGATRFISHVDVACFSLVKLYGLNTSEIWYSSCVIHPMIPNKALRLHVIRFAWLSPTEEPRWQLHDLCKQSNTKRPTVCLQKTRTLVLNSSFRLQTCMRDSLLPFDVT